MAPAPQTPGATTRTPPSEHRLPQAPSPARTEAIPRFTRRKNRRKAADNPCGPSSLPHTTGAVRNSRFSLREAGRGARCSPGPSRLTQSPGPPRPRRSREAAPQPRLQGLSAGPRAASARRRRFPRSRPAAALPVGGAGGPARPLGSPPERPCPRAPRALPAVGAGRSAAAPRRPRGCGKVGPRRGAEGRTGGRG